MRSTRVLRALCTMATLGVSGLALTAAARWASAHAAHDGVSPMVVVELFTSEGCSSCPPADDFLIDLLRTQPVPGVFVVGLSEHVDYWNRLGWRDPFSSRRFTERQLGYDAAVFGGGRVYTPQMVIDGWIDVLGNDRAGVVKAIRQAARAPRASVTLRARQDVNRMAVTVDGSAPPDLERQQPADVLMAITEDGLTTAVARGENSGRRLHHGGVVRALSRIGTWSPTQASFTASGSERLDPSWQVPSLRVVVLLQERESRRIIGAGTTALSQ